MKKTALVTIVNLYDGAKSMKVKNFSDENVKEVISKLIKVRPNELQCESSSIGGGIYSVNSPFAELDKVLQPIGLSKRGEFVQVKYGDIYE